MIPWSTALHVLYSGSLNQWYSWLRYSSIWVITWWLSIFEGWNWMSSYLVTQYFIWIWLCWIRSVDTIHDSWSEKTLGGTFWVSTVVSLTWAEIEEVCGPYSSTSRLQLKFPIGSNSFVTKLHSEVNGIPASMANYLEETWRWCIHTKVSSELVCNRRLMGLCRPLILGLQTTPCWFRIYSATVYHVWTSWSWPGDRNPPVLAWRLTVKVATLKFLEVGWKREILLQSAWRSSVEVKKS